MTLLIASPWILALVLLAFKGDIKETEVEDNTNKGTFNESTSK